VYLAGVAGMIGGGWLVCLVSVYGWCGWLVYLVGWYGCEWLIGVVAWCVWLVWMADVSGPLEWLRVTGWFSWPVHWFVWLAFTRVACWRGWLL
jgi:hypothetical protein